LSTNIWNEYGPKVVSFRHLLTSTMLPRICYSWISPNETVI
jgi:hypothetical protein